MPALPLDQAGKYVAGAYIVFMVLLVVYVAIMAIKLQRIERDLRDLASFAEQGSKSEDGRARNEDDRDPSEGALTIEESNVAPGRGSEGQSISVSAGPSESRGGDV